MLLKQVYSVSGSLQTNLHFKEIPAIIKKIQCVFMDQLTWNNIYPQIKVQNIEERKADSL